MRSLVLFVCRTHTQHKVSSLNAGDSLNTENEPEETTKKEKKSEALNIRGRLVCGLAPAPFPDSRVCAVSTSAFRKATVCWEVGQLPADYDPLLLPNHRIDSEGEAGC